MSIVKVAQRVGVSHVTVSRAMNDPGKVHPRTLAKIRKACHDLGFTPRVIPNRLKTVSLIVPPAQEILGMDNPHISRIAVLLSERGYQVAVTTVEGLDQLPSVFRKAFIALMRQNEAAHLPTIRRLASQVPFVAINDMLEEVGPNAVLVGSDHEHGIRLALEHFMERGHKRIAFVATSLTPRGHAIRYETYERVMRQHKLFDPKLVFINGEEMLPEGLRRINAEGATGILVALTELTSKTLYYLKLLGKEVPWDISLITHEVSGYYQFVYPPLTAFLQPCSRLAEQAVELLFRKLEGDKTVPHRNTVPYELIVRESVRVV